MRRMPIKMGKYTIKSTNTGNNHLQKHLLRDSCLDESNDSGLGPEFHLNFPESNSSSCFEESDVDSSSDSVDSGISCRNRRILAKSRNSLVANTVNPRTAYPQYSMMHIETSLSTSLNHKMHIHKANGDARSLHGHNEPPTKRRKVLPMTAPHDEKSRRSTVHHYPSASSGTGAGVLTEASLCVNSNTRSTYDEPLILDLPRDTMALKGSQEYLSRNGDHIAALLSPNSHTLSRKRSTKKPSLHQPFPVCSKDGKTELRILVQPEEQHRARYMTEGSRGSIKDEKGTGFPTVKLIGYNQPAVLQIFIGCDQGKVQPHLFYQACKVTGKNCTPCVERIIDGTYVIEIQLDPANDMTVSCDCIGILKERNVDVEQRLPYFGMTRCKKRSTKCRMVFRVNIPLANGSYETLQITSSPILCTQSPGLPEICKKSLTECLAKGGVDLFIIGKNFQKDARITFTEFAKEQGHSLSRGNIVWEESVEPEKEFIHQSHLVCCIPPYCNQDIENPVKVVMSVSSGGKSSEPHIFTYNPNKKVHKEDYERLDYEIQSRIHSVPVVIKQEWNSDTATSTETTCTSMSEIMSDVSSIMQPVIGNSIENSNDHTSPASFSGLNMHMVDQTTVNSLMNQCSNLLNMPMAPVEEQPQYNLVPHKESPKIEAPIVNSLVMNQCSSLLSNMPMPHVEEQQPFSLASHKDQSKVAEEVHHDDIFSGISQLATAIANEQQQQQQQQTLQNNETVHMMAGLQCSSNSNLNVLGQPPNFTQDNCFAANCNGIKSEMLGLPAPYCPTNSTEGIFVPATSSAASSMCSAALELNADTKVVNSLYSGISDDMTTKSLNNYLMTTEAGQSTTNSVSDMALSNMSSVEYGPVENPTLMMPTNKLSSMMGSCPNIAMTVAAGVTENHIMGSSVQEAGININQSLHPVIIKSEKVDLRLPETSSDPVDDTSVSFALTSMSDNDLLKMINTKDFQRTFNIC